MDATSSEIITTSASGSAAGADSAVGSALALAIVDSSTETTLERDIHISSRSIEMEAESYRKIETSSTAGSLGAEQADGSAQQGDVNSQIGAQVSLAESKTQELKGGHGEGGEGEGDDGEGDSGKTAPLAETGEGTVSVAAAIGVNLVSATTRAATADGANVSAGRLTLSSAANTDVSSRADGRSVDGDAASVGVASAVAMNKTTSVNEAYLGRGSHEVVSLTIKAYTKPMVTGLMDPIDQSNVLSASAISGAGAKDVGVAGALAVNLTDSRVAALIGEQAIVLMPSEGATIISAEDETVDRAIATPHETAAGNTVGVGASVAVNVAARQTLAELSDDSDIRLSYLAGQAPAENLTLKADSVHSMQTQAIAGASGGVAATAASAVSVSESATTARLGTKEDSRELLLWTGLLVSSESQESIATLAKGSSRGDDVAIGAAAAIALVDSTSEAITERNVRTYGGGAITLAAQGINRVDTQAIAGELGGKKKDTSTPDDGVDKGVKKQTDLAGKKKAEAKGEADSEGSGEESGSGGSDGKKVAPAAETADGKVSVAGAIGVNVVSATTRASVVDGVQVHAHGAVNLSLSSAANTDVSVKADGSTVDGNKGSVGVASAVALNKVTSTNEAYLGAGDHGTGGGLKLEAKTLEVGSGASADKQSEYKAEAVSGAGAQEVGVAGALAINLTDKSTVARIQDGATVEVQADGITVSATERSKDVAKALPAKDAISESDVGIGASAAFNVALGQTVADVAARTADAGSGGGMSILSSNHHTMETEAKAGAKGGVAVTAASAVALSEHEVLARYRLADGEPFGWAFMGGNIDIKADGTETVTTSAMGSASAQNVAVGAAVAVALVDASSEAAVEAGTGTVDIRVDNSGGSVNVAATDRVSVQTKATAGQLGEKAKDESTPAKGVDNKITQQSSTAKTKRDEAKREGLSDGSDKTAPSAKTADGDVDVASAVGVNVVTSTARAQIGDGVNLITIYGDGDKGLVSLTSAANTDVSVEADGSTVDRSKAERAAGVGVASAVALNKVTSTNEAYLGSGQHEIQKLQLEAKTLQFKVGSGESEKTDKQSEYKAVAKSGAGATNADVGVAGALAVNLTDSQTSAKIADAAWIQAGSGGVSVSAQSESKDEAVASPKDGASGDVGVGASVAVNVALAETVAEIPEATINVTGGGLSVSAAGRHTAKTEATAGAVGGVAVTPAVALSVIGNKTLASIGTKTEVTVAKDSSVKATNAGSVETTAKGQSTGQNAAIGAAVALTFAEGTAEAALGGGLVSSGGAVTIEASNSTSAQTSSEAGAKGGQKEQAGAPKDGVDKKIEDQKRLANEKKDEAAREGSAATTPADKQTPSAKTDEGSVSVAAAISVSVIESAARAHTAELAEIDAGKNLTVRSSSNTDAVVKANASAVEGNQPDVGVGAAVAINSMTTANEAYLDSGIYHVRGLTIEAKMRNTGSEDDPDTTANSSVEAVSGAGSEDVGVAGSLALNIVSSTTLAQIRELADVDAGGMDVVLTAESRSTDVAKAAPQKEGATGSVGVGASVALNALTDVTEAGIGSEVRVGDGAALTGARNLTISASSDHDSETEAKAGAEGGVSIDAAVAVAALNQQTMARIASGSGIASDIDASGTVSLDAKDSGGGTVKAFGNTQSSNVGVGASVAVLSTDTEVKALVDRDLEARGDLNITAEADRTYLAEASASASGAKDEKSGDQTNTSAKKLDETKDKQEGTKDGGKVLVAAAVAISEMDDNVRAYISGGSGLDDSNYRRDVGVDGNVNLSATNKSNYSTRADGSSASLSTSTGVSNAVALSIVDNETEAYIGNFSTLSGVDSDPTGNITVKAVATQNTSGEYVNRLAAEAISGSGAEKVGVAGALAVTNSDADTKAYVGDDAVIQDAGSVSITADNTSKLSAKAWDGAASGKVGVGASVATIVSRNLYDAHVGDRASISAASLEISAKSNKVSGDVPFEFTDFDSLNLQPLLGQNNYYTEAIAGGAAKEVAVSGAYAVNYFEDVVTAFIGSSTFVESTGAVTIGSQYDALAKASTGAVSGALNTGVGGSHVNVVNRTDIGSRIHEGAQIGAGSVNVLAHSRLDVGSFGVSAAGADKAGVVGVTSVVQSENQVRALIGDNALVRAGWGGVGEGDLIVEATNEHRGLTIAGGAAGGSKAGVGMSLATNLIDNETEAFIGKADVWAYRNTSVSAKASEDLKSIAAGGAYAGSASVAPSTVINTLTADAKSYIAPGARVNSAGGFAIPSTSQTVSVTAKDLTDLVSVAGAAAFGGKAGVGAGVDVSVIDKTTKAYIASSVSDLTTVNAYRKVEVLAESSEDIVSVSGSADASLTVGVAGSTSVYNITNTTQGYIGNHAVVSSNGSVLVSARDDNEMRLIDGSAAYGGTAGVGASGAVAVIDKTTEAFVGAGASVTARGSGEAAEVDAGRYIISYETLSSGDGRVGRPKFEAAEDLTGDGKVDEEDRIESESLTKDRVATVAKTSVRGLAVTAAAKDHVESIAVGGAMGSVGVSAGATVTKVSNETRAYIGADAEINQVTAIDGPATAVLVAAGTDFYHLGIAGTLAGGMKAGVGPGADITVVENITEAYVDDSSTVDAQGDVSIQAHSTEEILSIAATAAAGGAAGVAGSVSVNYINNRTHAWVDGDSQIDARGSVTLVSEDSTEIDVIDGTFAFGVGAGVSQSVGVTVVSKDTQAYIGEGSTVNAEGNSENEASGLIVSASSREDILNVVAGGGAGVYAGVAGAVTVNKVDSRTTAFIGDESRINMEQSQASSTQSVSVNAQNDVAVKSITAGVAGGVAGVSGAVNVGLIKNDTAAYLGRNVELNARKNVSVSASALRNLKDYTLVHAGGAVGVTGGVSVWVVGRGLDLDVQTPAGSLRDVLQSSDDKSIEGVIDKQLRDPDADAVRSSSDSMNMAMMTGGTQGLSIEASGDQGNSFGELGFWSIVDFLLGGLISDFTAFAEAVGAIRDIVNTTMGILADVDLIGDDRRVDERAALPEDSDSVSIAMAVTSAGAGVVPSGTNAFTRDGVQINAHDISLSAKEIIDFDQLAAGATIGAFATGAAVSVTTLQPVVSAHTGSNVTFNGGGSVALSSYLDQDHDVKTMSGVGSAFGDLGGSIIYLSDEGQSIAETGASTKITGTGGVSITATSERTSNLQALIGALSGGTISGAVIYAKDSGITKAATGTSAGISAGDDSDILVKAGSVVSLIGKAVGLQATAALAVGVPYTKLEDASTTTAIVGNNSRIDRARNASVVAQHVPHVNAETTGVGVSGGVTAQAVLSRAMVTGSVKSYLGDGVTVGAAQGMSVGSLDVVASLNPPARVRNAAVALVDGGAIGAVSGIGADAVATIDPIIDAHIGAAARVTTSRDITVRTESLAGAKAEARGLNLSALFTIGVSIAEAKLAPDIKSYVGSSSSLNSVTGSIIVQARHNTDANDRPLADYGAWADAWSAVGSLGLGGVGSDADAVSSAHIESYVAGGAGSLLQAAGAVTIASYSSNRANATADGHAYSVVAGGAVLADSVVAGTNTAHLDAATVSAGQLTVSAKTSDESKALTKAGAGGIAAGSGSIATVKAESETSAYTGPSVSATVWGQMNVTASAQSVADAESRGVNISASLTIGVSKAEAKNAPKVSAYIGQSNMVSSGMLIIDARILPAPEGRNESTRAYASGSTGGLGVGFAATDTKAESAASVEAFVGGGSTLTVTGPASVYSQASTKQNAYSTGKTLGGLAIGGNTAIASSDTTTKAYLGHNVVVSGSLMDIFASGKDDNYAEAVAGTGGAIAGHGASAQTTTRGATAAWVSSGSQTARIDVGEFRLTSEHESVFNAKTDTITASVVGMSGSSARNDVDHSVTVDILSGAVIRAGSLSVKADNWVVKDPLDEYNVRSGSGGLFDGPAAESTTTIKNRAIVAVGQNASIEVYGGTDGSGGLTMSAWNAVVAQDMVGLDSGGAIAVAQAKNRIENSLNDARIAVGSGSRLASSRDIALSASGLVEIETLAMGKTFGLSGAAMGSSEARATMTNVIEIGTGARLEADGNIRLQAGSSDLEHTVTARTLLWNRTAFPINTDPVANAYLSESNNISIGTGASVGAAGDISLSTQLGGRTVYGYGKATDFYREAAEYLANLLNDVFDFSDEEITLEKEYRSSTEVYSSRVNVDGTVEVGRKRHYQVIINQDGTLSPETTAGMTVFPSTENLRNTVQERLNEVVAAIEFIEEDGVDDVEAPLHAELVAERGQLTEQLRELKNRENAGILNVSQPIEIRLGNIYIDALSLTGSGSLRAPGDAVIRIENSSPNYLRTNLMTISEEGRIYFNGMGVTTPGQVNTINADSGGRFNGDLQVGGTPTISVVNKYYDSDGWGPDIFIDKSIINLKGTVEIRSDYGSVQVGKNADIVAETVRISAGRNIYIGYSDGFTHVAGDVRQRWAGLIRRFESVGGEAVLVKSPRQLAEEGEIDLGDLDTPSLIAGNKVFIAGQYLNINGIVQSGVPNRELVISPDDVEDQIRAHKADYESKLARGENPNPLYSLSIPGLSVVKDDKGYVVSSGIEVFYNAAENCLELTPIPALGGYMELVGHIMNTGIGELRVLDGYSQIFIFNETQYALKLRNISAGAGEGIEGRIKIIDYGKRTDSAHVSYFANTPLVTEITRVGSAIQVRSNRVPDWDDPLKITTLEYTTPGRLTGYQPRENQYYSWTSLTETVTTETKTAIMRIIGGDISIEDGEPVTESSSRDLQIDHLRVLPGHDETYWYRGQVWTILDTGWGQSGDPVIIRDEDGYRELLLTYARFIWQAGVHEHNISASNTIRINFVGHDEGRIRVTSPTIIVDGLIESGAGLVWMIATGSSGSIMQTANPAAGIRAATIQFDAAGSVGSASNPITTDLLGGVFRATSGGDIFINEIAGDLICEFVDASGEVNLVAEGTISTGSGYISGRRVVLESKHGGIGFAPWRANVDAGPEGLKARASGSIYITDYAGDLAIDSVVSLNGDVDLMASEGSIIDVNPNQERDVVAEAEMLEFWERIRLTGEAAKRSADDTVTAYENQKLREYQTYWQYRERFRGKDGSILPYSPKSVIVLSESEKHYFATELGWTESMIRDHEARLTAEYHELHSKYGSATGSFDPKWRYTVERPKVSGSTVYDPKLYDTERFSEWYSLTSGHSWSEGELRNSVSASLVSKELTDTKLWIEEPNIVGRNITLSSSGSIGHDQEVIIPVQRTVYGKFRLVDRLTAEQIVMLLSAEKKDVTLLGGSSIRITSRETVDVDASGHVIALAPQGFVYLASEKDMNVFRIMAGGDARITANGTIENARSDEQENVIGRDVFLEAGHGRIGALKQLVVRADGSLTARAYYVDIHSTGDLTVDEIYGRDWVNLTSVGSITGSTVTHPVLGLRGYHFRTGSLTLRSDGSIGSAAQPLTVKLDPTGMLNADAYAHIYISSPDSSLTTGLVTAEQGSILITTGEDIYIRSRLGSASPLNPYQPYGIYAERGSVQIEAGGSILDGDNDVYVSIVATQINLFAGGSIGTDDNELELQAMGSARLLYAYGPEGVFIRNIGRDLQVGEIASSRDVRLSVTNGALLLGRIHAVGGIVTLTAGTYIANNSSASGNNIVADSIRLEARGGGVGSSSKPLLIDTRAPYTSPISVTAAGGIFLTETAGDMVLSQIATSDALLGRIELTSTGGGILNGNTDGSPNIVIDSPIGLILLSASGDIGASNPLVYDALDAALRVTSQGSVYVRSRRGIVLDLIAARERAVLEAENGHIQQTVTGSIEASMVELFAESGGIGMKDQRVVVSAARVNALAYGDIFLEIQGRYVFSDYIKSLAGTVDVYRPGTIDQLLAGLSQTDRILGGMASGGSIPQLSTGLGLTIVPGGAVNLGGPDGGPDGGRVVFGGGSQDGDQDQGEDEDEDEKGGQDGGQDDGKGDRQGGAGSQSGSPLFPRR